MSGFTRAIGQWRCCSLAATFREFNNLLSPPPIHPRFPFPSTQQSASSLSIIPPLSAPLPKGSFHAFLRVAAAPSTKLTLSFLSNKSAAALKRNLVQPTTKNIAMPGCVTFHHIGAQCVHRSQSKPPSPPMSDACIFPPPSGGGENAREGSKRESPRRFVYRLLTASLRRGGFSISEILFGRRGDGTLPKQSRSRNGE